MSWYFCVGFWSAALLPWPQPNRLRGVFGHSERLQLGMKAMEMGRMGKKKRKSLLAIYVHMFLILEFAFKYLIFAENMGPETPSIETCVEFEY